MSTVCTGNQGLDPAPPRGYRPVCWRYRPTAGIGLRRSRGIRFIAGALGSSHPVYSPAPGSGMALGTSPGLRSDPVPGMIACFFVILCARVTAVSAKLGPTEDRRSAKSRSRTRYVPTSIRANLSKPAAGRFSPARRIIAARRQTLNCGAEAAPWLGNWQCRVNKGPCHWTKRCIEMSANNQDVRRPMRGTSRGAA